MSDIEEALRSYIADTLMHGSHQPPPQDDSQLLHEGYVDSLGLLKLVRFVEQAYGLRVPNRAVTVEQFGSIEGIARWLRAALDNPQDGQ